MPMNHLLPIISLRWKGFITFQLRLFPACMFLYLRQINSTGRGFLLFLSGTGCLALPFVLLFIYVSNYDATTQSATFPTTSEGCRDVKENYSLKCISQRGTREIIKSKCWIQKDKSQSREIRCHIPVSAKASTGICDIVSPSTEI